MSIFARPVSEIYHPELPHQLDNVEPNGHYADWGYTLAYETDEAGQEVPHWGNTAIFRILEDGMTEPRYVTKTDSQATFTVKVLAGQGILIRALTSGAVETIALEENDEIIIKPGQAYSYVNTGKKDLLLYDVAKPAFRPSDDVALTQSLLRPKDDKTRPSETSSYLYCETANSLSGRALPSEFYDRIGQAAAGRLKP